MNTSPLLLTAMVAVSLPVLAQERTASANLGTEASWAALKSLTEQANSNAKTAHVRIDQSIICAKAGKLYAPGAPESDSQGCKTVFDPKELMVKTGSVSVNGALCGSGAHSCAPDGRTVEKLCQRGGYSYATGTSVKGYDSPKNNWIGRWTGTSWQVFNAREANTFLLALTCQTIKWK